MISLTSIPPRLPRLAPVIESLLRQQPAPEAVYLCLPRRWDRFGAIDPGFEAPEGVVIHMSEVDHGPSLKVISLVNDPQILAKNIIYCDDDWIYPQGWAATLLNAGTHDEAVAASGFPVDRLRRRGASSDPDFVDVAQGFGGVSIDPKWLRLPDAMPPPGVRFADDIWLSGQLARQGVPIRFYPAAREGMRPAFEDAYGLQDLTQPGHTRAEVNWAALNELTRRYGIWPEM